MKIISKGQVPSTLLRFRCTHCGTVFECDKSEATFVPDQRDGDYWRVMCPLEGCGRVASFQADGKYQKRWGAI